MKKTFLFLLVSGLVVYSYGQKTTEKLDELVSAYANVGKFNGAVLVSRRGEILLQKGYGIKNDKKGESLSADDVFQLYSITKTFTSTLVMKLEEEGKLKLSDKLEKYYPGFSEGNTITIENLLTHTSGIYDYTRGYNMPDIKEKTLVDFLRSKPFIKQPKTPEDWYNSFRKAIIRKIKELEEKLTVTELSFNGFYDYCDQFLPLYLNNRKHRITEMEFNLRTFLFVLKDFYKGGRYGTTLNESADNTLFDESFIVFEIDNVKDNPKLFPIVTLIIMDTFIQKMRLRKDRRKALIIEEAWKAIASKLMGGYILYLYKTVRKFWGEAVVVTQELDDIIGNAVVKDSIINNSDTFILLDQTKFKDNFDRIAALLSLNKVEQNKIFTINNLNNKFGRSRFKEFYLKRGSKGEVYGNEVSIEQYLTYTTEKPEKSAVEYYVQKYGNYDEALRKIVIDLKTFGDSLENLVSLVNLYQNPLDNKISSFYRMMKKEHKGKNVFKVISQELEDRQINFSKLINKQQYGYEKV